MFALRAPTEALPVGLLVTPEPALKVFQDGPGDLPAARQVALRRPGQKEFKGVAPVLDGLRRVVAHGQGFQVAVEPLRQRVRCAAVKTIGLLVVAAALLFGALGHYHGSGKALRAVHTLWLRQRVF